MKSFIHELGVIDINDQIHPVYFQEGLNIVTGRSSTGKSALIEIFDYCFGSSEYTIPVGVITKNTQFYYTIIQVKEQVYLLARRPKQPSLDKILLRKINYNVDINIINMVNDSVYWLPSASFKKELNKIYGIDFSNVNLISTEEKSNYGRNKKQPTPSVRSCVSFMMQHQNLIANKHALFYRFDEKEKRDQVVNHTKNFLNLVDQKYYLSSQEKEELELKLKKLERVLEFNKKERENKKEQIQLIIDEIYDLFNFASSDLSKITANNFLNAPQLYKDEFDKLISFSNFTIEKTDQIYISLENNFRNKSRDFSRLKMRKRALEKAIEESQELINDISTTNNLPKQIMTGRVICPFCSAESTSLNNNVDKLKTAINHLSNNIYNLRPSIAQYEVELVKIDKLLDARQDEVKILKNKLLEIEEVNENFKKNRSFYELALTKKGTLFNIIDNLTIVEVDNEDEVKKIVEDLQCLKRKLEGYDVKNKLNEASKKVNQYMNEIGEYFDIEDSYRDGRLNFDFQNFDLYFLLNSGEKIYLRSMGSGANWLYCHVTLFLALHKYFVELGDTCNVPSILFLDQPTQVYFPNFSRDNSSSFDEMKLSEIEFRNEAKDKGIGIREIDDDMISVTKLFSKLALYCENLKKEYGYSPQIIVTDHADNLELNGFQFEDFVNGNRWRDRGLIHPIPSDNIESDN